MQSSGAPPATRQRHRRREPADRHARRRARCGSATSPTCGSRRRRTRSSARAPSRRIDVGANVRGPRPGLGRRRRRGAAGARSSSRSAYHAECSASTTERQRRRRTAAACSAGAAADRRSSCCCRPPSAACGWPCWPSSRCRWRWSAACWRRGSSDGVLSLGSLVGFLTVLRHRRPQRHPADQPLPAPRARGGRAVRPGAGAARAPRSGWRRS